MELDFREANTFNFCCWNNNSEKCEALQKANIILGDLMKNNVLRIFFMGYGIVTIFANIFAIKLRIQCYMHFRNKVPR